MSERAPADWEDAVETLRRDLQVVADDDADEEDVSAAMDEVWAVVDAFDERVGDVDVGVIADALGADPDAAEEEGLDPTSIPNAFVADDPRRAASLGRMLSLVDLDDATDHDVGRLWESGRSDAADDGPGDGEEASEAAEGAGAADGGAGAEDDTDTDADADSEDADSTDSDSGAGSADDLRSRLADSIDDFRDRVEEARGQLVDSTGSEESTSDHADGGSSGGDEADGGRSTSSGRAGGSGRSNRSATAFSTVPSNRHDVGGTTGVSTVPGKRGRSRSSGRRSSTGDGDVESRDGGEQDDSGSEGRDEG